MASYIGKVQIGSEAPALIGSTLYGICSTSANVAAKVIGPSDDAGNKFINTHYDDFIQGTTIHVKFVDGNTADSNVTLAVGSTSAAAVIGNCTCPANTIISFTLDENQHWVTNDNVDTNTEYVFKGNTPYNATSNKALAESSVSEAAYKGVVIDMASNTSSTDLPTVATVVSYVNDRTAGLSGLTGAMHFKGSVTAVPTTAVAYTDNYDSGDVVLAPDKKEYVFTRGVDAEHSYWTELGDEGSYALKSSTSVITEVTSFTANTLPTLSITSVTVSNVSVSNGSAASLTTTSVTIPNVTQAGIATTASVSAGVLTITLGRDTQLAANPISITGVNEFTPNTPTTVSATAVTVGSASDWDAGTQASLNTSDTTVVVPGTLGS